MFNSSQKTIPRLVASLGLLIFGSLSVQAAAADHLATLMPYVSNDTFAVAFVDVALVKLPDDRGALLKAAPQLSGTLQSFAFAGLFAQDFITRFQEADGQGLYAIAGLADVHEGGGPLVLATARTGQPIDKVERMLKDVIQKIQKNTAQSAAAKTAEQLTVERKGDVVLLGMKSTIDLYAARKADERKELVEPLAKLADGGAAASVVFCPGPDFRRVVRELWPQLPGVLAPMRGELADRWISLEGSINMPPNISPKLTLQAKDAESAELFAKLWHDLPTATTQFGGNEQSNRQVKGYAQLLVDTLPANVEGTRVVIGFPTEAGQFLQLGSMFSEAANKSMEVSRRKERMNRFRQMLLGMLNFESAKKHLPPAAICDKDGKPLLSWRVAILPYLDETELYKQFHLDEAWDSPHNRPLVEKMPAIFSDPDPAIQSAAGAGKTTFQVPVGKETAFYNNDGTTLREITDGTANTILIVDVAPTSAVEWTKPADWNVDPAHPREGLGSPPRDFVTAGYADGHIQAFSRQRLDDKPLRASLTRAGGEAAGQ
jgi:hypothetical protein